MNTDCRAIAIITSGSRGDIQPFIALALGLKEAGYAVRIVTHEVFRQWILSCKLDFFPLAGDPKALIASEAGQQFISPRNLLAFFQGAKRLNQEVKDMFSQQMRDGLIAAQGMDAVVCSFSAPLSIFVGEKLSIPSICAALAPITRTVSFPTVVAAPRTFGPRLNRLSHRAFEFIVECLLRRNIQIIRREHNLPKQPFGSLFRHLYEPDALFLNAFSRKIVDSHADWPSTHVLTGFWIIPNNTEYVPPTALKDFLSNGKPPVYIGFGSMVDKSPAELTQMAVEAAKLSGNRLIISKGWANLATSALPDFVYAVEDVPHEWLFPQLKGIVHHGGAGTTAAALRSGVPSTVVPFGVDQSFWGWRVALSGAGCEPIPRKKLNSENLAAAFNRMSEDKDMQKKAVELGSLLRQEQGVLDAIKKIDEFLKSRRK